MPKKHKRTFIARPSNTAPHTLVSSLGRDANRHRPATSSPETSVNDLISHLRRTQVPSSSDTPSPSRAQTFESSRSVPPSLRNVLDLPEAQAPRSRPNATPQTVIGRRRRPTPGPPPPESWLAGNNRDSSNEDFEVSPAAQRVIYRLQRLPDVTFPEEGSLQHAVLKSMALNFALHLDYDGNFLLELPLHVRVRLFSYVASFGHAQQLAKRMKGLKPLLLTEVEPAGNTDDEPDIELQSYVDEDLKTSRLDLGCAMGNWLSFKQLTQILFGSKRPETATAQDRIETIPESWEEHTAEYSANVIPQSLSEGLRFANLRYLSLAHPNKDSVSWDSLNRLLSRLSTITHLSLAHWPAPFRGRAGDRPWYERHRSTGESSAILRTLCYNTYCLKWLDLEGCSDWISDLTWADCDAQGNIYPLTSTGPVWNKPWRDIEWINLAPGWNLVDLETWNKRFHSVSFQGSDIQSGLLDTPVYAPPHGLGTAGDFDLNSEDQRTAFYHYQKTAETWLEEIRRSVKVYQQLVRIRAFFRGKRIEAITGAEGLDLDEIHRQISSIAQLARQRLS